MIYFDFAYTTLCSLPNLKIQCFMNLPAGHRQAGHKSLVFNDT